MMMMESDRKRRVLALACITGAITALASWLTWKEGISAVPDPWAAFSRTVMVICWLAFIVMIGLRRFAKRIERDRVDTFMHDLETTKDLPRNFRYPYN